MILHNQDKSVGEVLTFLNNLTDFQLIQMCLEFQKNMSDLLVKHTPKLKGYNILANEFDNLFKEIKTKELF